MWITRVSIKNPVFAVMVMVALCVLGLFSLSKLGVEQMPDISLPGAWIEVSYPGASPEAVEREIAKPLEEAVNSVAGVKRITSRSFEGKADMSVEFNLDTDMGRAMQDVRDRIAAVQASFPVDAKAPTVARWNNDNSQPVVNLALLSKTRGTRELSILAEQLVAKRLQRVAGVARVDINGLTEREVRIDLDPQRLRAYGVTPAEIATALKDANADQPVGLITDPVRDALLRVEGRVRDPRHFANIVVARRGDLALTLADLGTLVEREKEPDSLARINGQQAVSFNVFKQQDANIVATGDAVKQAMDEIRKNLPPDVELRLIYASSDWVKGSLTGLEHTLVEGALLTVAIVFLFLHSWRSTIITGLTLPIAVVSSFIAIYLFGFTLNFMTMMALSLCIGLLIDDAIVVRENIVRHVHLGKDHLSAARDGTEEIGLAVMATTFALVAVFVPVAFMGGIIGKFFYPFGITVVVAVLVSLFVSFTLDPMLSSVWKDPPSARLKTLPVLGHADPRHRRAARRAAPRLRAADPLGLQRPALSGCRCRPTATAFAPTPRATRRSPRRWRRATLTPRGVVLAVGVASFVVAIALAPLVGSEFVPQTDQSYTQLALRMPVGSSLRAQRRQGAPGRADRDGDARGPDGEHLDRRCRPAQPGLAEHRAETPQRARAQPEAGRGRDPRRDREDPRHRRVARLRPADLRRDPGQRRAGAGTGRERVRREGQDDQGRGRRRVVGAAGPAGLRGAAQAGGGARARPDRAPARIVAARLRQRRDRDHLDRTRRRPGRRRAAPEREPARASGPAAHAAGGVLEGRHAGRAGQRRDDRAGVQPRGDPAPGPDAPRSDLRRRQGPQPGRRRRRRAEADQGDATCRRACTSTSAARCRTRPRPSPACSARWRSR